MVLFCEKCAPSSSEAQLRYLGAEPTQWGEIPIVTVLSILFIIILRLPFWGPEHIQKLTKFGVHIGTGQIFQKFAHFRGFAFRHAHQRHLQVFRPYKTHRNFYNLHEILHISASKCALQNFVKNKFLLTFPTVHLIPTKCSSQHYYTKLVNPY